MIDHFYCRWQIVDRIQMDHNSSCKFNRHFNKAYTAIQFREILSSFIILSKFSELHNQLHILTSKFFVKKTIRFILISLTYSCIFFHSTIFSIHVVFGHVVSGHDLVRQLEQLPVDRNSRPLQDAMISNCGELIRQIKGNKDFLFCNSS